MLPAVWHFRICDMKPCYWNDYSLLSKEQLLTQRSAGNLPKILVVAFHYISSDLKHDRAYAQHTMDDQFKWIKKYTNCTNINMVSDGCSGQFKSCHTLGWGSTVKAKYELNSFTWTYFCSAHGKCMCGTCFFFCCFCPTCLYYLPNNYFFLLQIQRVGQ